MTTRGDEGPDPVSVAITRRVKPGQTEAFEAWLEEIRDLAARFDGCMGMDVIRPADASTTTYVVIVRFDSYDLYRTRPRSRSAARPSSQRQPAPARASWTGTSFRVQAGNHLRVVRGDAGPGSGWES